ncbi:MAG: M50 family metallopeptidase [Planctomycetaceae bacterium]
MNESDTKRLRATAFHEAGHAVMALLLGRPIEKVTISPAQLKSGGTRLGACKIQKGRTKPSKDEVEDSALILLAGMVAESFVTGQYNQAGAAQDLQMMKSILTANRARDEKRFQKIAKRMVDKTEHLLGQPFARQAVRQIAAQLIEHETISGRAARHLLDVARKQAEE